MRRSCAWIAVAAVILMAATASAGDMKVAPYGFVLVNAGFNNHVATDIPVRASVNDTGDTRTNFLLTARQTRFGLKMVMDSVQGWTVKGQVELDFWGQKGSFTSGGSMQSAPRLRLAYFALKKENLQLLFGQDWSCFAPLNPNSLAHVSITVFSGSGNLWNRFPQIRLDYTVPLANENSVLIQIAAVRPIAGDVTDDSQAETLGAGEFGAAPFGQARVAFSHADRLTVGVSVHIGQEDWQKAYPWVGYPDEKTTTAGMAGDARVTAGIATFAAEGYVGTNLIMMSSNAATFDDPEYEEPEVEGFDVAGGWGEVTIKPVSSKVSFNGGAGIEVVDGDQVEKMVNPMATVKLWKNLTVFGAVMYDPLPKVTFALEIGYIKTTYKCMVDGERFDSAPTNLNVNAGFRFSF
jgi:hypothetical protein